MFRVGFQEQAFQTKIQQLELSIQQALVKRPSPAQLLFALQSSNSPIRQLLSDLGVDFSLDVDEDLNDSLSSPSPDTYEDALAELLSSSFVRVSSEHGIQLSLPLVAEAFTTKTYQQSSKPEFVTDIELSVLLAITEELLHTLQVVAGERGMIRMVSKTERIRMVEMDHLFPLPGKELIEEHPEGAKFLMKIPESDILYWMLEQYNGDYPVEYESELTTTLLHSGIIKTTWWRFRLAEYGQPLGLKPDTDFVLDLLMGKEA